MFPHEYVQKLRQEAAGYRTELNTAQAALNFYINRYPLGDLENFSVSRAAYAHAHQKMYGTRRMWDVVAPYEKAYYERKSQGEYVSGQDGGFLAPEIWAGPYFSLLRGFSVLSQLPVTRVSVPARVVHIPKVQQDPSGTYPVESAAGTNTSFLIGQVSYTARKAEHLVPVSNELIRDAAGVADQLLRKESALYHAFDRDTQLLTGQGGPNPTGLITLASNGTISKYYPNATATSSISATPAHAVPSFHHVSQLRGKVHQLNGSTSFPNGQAHCNGIIAHTRFEQTVLQLQVSGSATGWTDANGRPLWMAGLGSRPGDTATSSTAMEYADPTSLMGQIWALTNIVPVNSTDGGGTASSFMIAGWWDMYVLFESAEFLYDAAIEPAFANDQTLIRAIHRYDGAPARPEAFAVLAGCDPYANQ
jgi:hypothetical protein